MKFRMFEQNGRKLAINVDHVSYVGVVNEKTRLYLAHGDNTFIIVDEDFDTAVSRLNTIAE